MLRTKKLKMRKKDKKFLVAIFIALLLIITIGVCVEFWNYFSNNNSNVYSNGELSIHFLELGNNYSGDSIYIKSGTTDVLIDGGSRTGSSETIRNYIKNFVTDNVLEYVIVTHADRDHIAAFAGDGSNKSLFEYYGVGTIIDFPKTNKESATLSRYYQKRDDLVSAGTAHYTALECWNQTSGAKQSYELSDGVTLNILYNFYYENSSSDENNYSVCFQIEQGDNKFLFTGDLEKEGEQKLVENNDLTKVKLFKAGHHGSKTSSNDVLLNVIKPEIVVVTCVAGSVEYTQNLSNTFPTQDFIDRISEHTTQVYVTTLGNVEENQNDTKKYKDVGFSSFNGNIVVTLNQNGVSVSCSNTNTLLKDSAWFTTFRNTPPAWA